MKDERIQMQDIFVFDRVGVTDAGHLRGVPGRQPVSVELVLSLEEDDAGASWAQGVAREWAEGLADLRQDLYTLEDGQPVDAPR